MAFELTLATCRKNLTRNKELPENEKRPYQKSQGRYFETIVTYRGNRARRPVRKPAEFWKRIRASRNVVIMVHGYNNDYAEATRSYWHLGKLLIGLGLRDEWQIAAFTWPSMAKKLGFYKDQCRARRSSVALYNFLRDISQKCPGVKAHLIGHSLGCYLIGHTLNRVAQQGGARPVETIMMAATLDNDELRGPRGTGRARVAAGFFYPGTTASRRITSYYSWFDKVLKKAYSPFGGQASALGLRGPYNPYRKCMGKNFYFVDASVHVEKKHGAYWSEPNVMEDIVQVLRGKAAGAIPGRKPMPRTRVHRQWKQDNPLKTGYEMVES
jgi:esterase/lipase superfamily enzyme